MYTTAPFQPARFTSEGKIVLNQVEISYKTVCEDTVFYSETGKPLASIFSYSYFRTDVAHPEQRPVLFIFNGGPGASSMMVHGGCFGLKRVKYPDSCEDYPTLPPYEVIDNPDCLLDIADLVMVDPIGTGFGCLLDETEEKRFLGIDEDAEALVMFVNQWLARYHRFSSPKYLVGESYGCTRAATAAAIAFMGGKKRSYTFVFDGIICIGNTISVAKYFNMGPPVEKAVEALPTMAAIHWYHNHPSDQSVEDFVREAAEFAATEYLQALFLGEDLPQQERTRLVEKLRYYTGVSEKYLMDHDLQLERISFRSELLSARNEVISIVDGRFKRKAHAPFCLEGTPGYSMDATMQRYGPLFRGGLEALFRFLNIEFDRPFVPSVSFGTELQKHPRWNFETAQFVSGQRLYQAMHGVPCMRTFFINGWYDLCTQNGIIWHTMSHCHLPKERTFFKGYPSGHMAYLGEENVKAVSRDIRVFLLGGDPTANS